MRCLKPRTVGFQDDGKTICWSPKNYSKEYPTFQLPCGKCWECRLGIAREKAVRCIHEAQMHEENSFITLTYSDQHVTKRLDYSHFQNFMKRLRWTYPNREIGYVVTGEYGDKTKRPHWHAIIFNWSPPRAEFLYKSELGHKVYRSDALSHRHTEHSSSGGDSGDNGVAGPLWHFGNAEFGSVTLESAGYVCRYAAKKLVHGADQDHEYHPVHKMSSKHAIGKRWLERYWTDVFNHGVCRVMDGTGTVVQTGIPRYYEKWLKKHQPSHWIHYVTQIKFAKIQQAEERDRRVRSEEAVINHARLDAGKCELQIDHQKVREIISKDRFKRLQSHLKGDI